MHLMYIYQLNANQPHSKQPAKTLPLPPPYPYIYTLISSFFSFNLPNPAFPSKPVHCISSFVRRFHVDLSARTTKLIKSKLNIICLQIWHRQSTHVVPLDYAERDEQSGRSIYISSLIAIYPRSSVRRTSLSQRIIADYTMCIEEGSIGKSHEYMGYCPASSTTIYIYKPTPTIWWGWKSSISGVVCSYTRVCPDHYTCTHSTLEWRNDRASVRLYWKPNKTRAPFAWWGVIRNSLDIDDDIASV